MKQNPKPPKQSVPFLIAANPDNPLEFKLTNKAGCPECSSVFSAALMADGKPPEAIKPGFLMACCHCGQLVELIPNYSPDAKPGEMVAVCVPAWSGLRFIPCVKHGQEMLLKLPAVREYRRKKLELN